MTTMDTTPLPPARKRLSWRKIALMLFLLAVVLLLGRMWLVSRMMLPRLIINQGTLVTELDLTPDGRTILVGVAPNDYNPRQRQNADIFVWDAANGKLIRRLPGFYWRSEWLAASPDGNHVLAFGSFLPLSNSSDATSIWDWHSGQKIWTASLMPPLCYSPNGRLVGSSSGIFDAMTGKLVRRLADKDRIADDGQSKFTPDGKLFGIINATHIDPKTGFNDESNGATSLYGTNRLHLWNVENGKEAKDFPFTRIRAFDFSRDGRWLIMVGEGESGDMINASDGSTVRCINIQTGAVAWTRERSMNDPDHDPDAMLNSVAISPNGKYVVIESNTNRLTVLDAKTGQELFHPWTLSGRGGPNWAIPGGLAFSADGRTLVSRCVSYVLVWDTHVLQ